MNIKKQGYSIITFIVVLVILNTTILSNISTVLAAPQGWETKTWQGITVSIPPGWKVEQSKKEFRAIKGNMEEGFLAFSFGKERMNIPIEAIVGTLDKATWKQLDPVTVSNFETQTYQVTSNAQDGKTMHQRFHFFSKPISEGAYLGIQYAVMGMDPGEHMPTLEKIRNSISFGPGMFKVVKKNETWEGVTFTYTSDFLIKGKSKEKFICTRSVDPAKKRMIIFMGIKAPMAMTAELMRESMKVKGKKDLKIKDMGQAEISGRKANVFEMIGPMPGAPEIDSTMRYYTLEDPVKEGGYVSLVLIVTSGLDTGKYMAELGKILSSVKIDPGIFDAVEKTETWEGITFSIPPGWMVVEKGKDKRTYAKIMGGPKQMIVFGITKEKEAPTKESMTKEAPPGIKTKDMGPVSISGRQTLALEMVGEMSPGVNIVMRGFGLKDPLSDGLYLGFANAVIGLDPKEHMPGLEKITASIKIDQNIFKTALTVPAVKSKAAPKGPTSTGLSTKTPAASAKAPPGGQQPERQAKAPSTTQAASNQSEVMSLAYVYKKKGFLDYVGRNKKLKRNGSPDSQFRLHISAPGKTLVGLKIINTDGQASNWNTLFSEAGWLLCVAKKGKFLNKKSGEIQIALDNKPEKFDIYVQDNNSIAVGKTNYEMVLIFKDGTNMAMAVALKKPSKKELVPVVLKNVATQTVESEPIPGSEPVKTEAVTAPEAMAATEISTNVTEPMGETAPMTTETASITTEAVSQITAFVLPAPKMAPVATETAPKTTETAPKAPVSDMKASMAPEPPDYFNAPTMDPKDAAPPLDASSPEKIITDSVNKNIMRTRSSIIYNDPRLKFTKGDDGVIRFFGTPEAKELYTGLLAKGSGSYKGNSMKLDLDTFVASEIYTYKNGLRDGKQYIWKDGRLWKVFSEKKGEKDGTWILYGEKFAKKMQCYKDGEEDGPYAYWSENGNLSSKGSHKEGKQHGVDESYSRNGKMTFTMTYVNGKQYGPIKYYSSKSGLLESEGHRKDGKKDGVEKKYDKEGKLKSEITYKEGKKDGHYKIYYKNGSMKEEAWYKDGKLDGLKKKFTEDGILSTETTYAGGKKNGKMKSYNIATRELYKEATYKDNIKDGAFKSYSSNGNMTTMGTYKMGKVNGLLKDYYEDGALFIESMYKDGQYHGSRKTYYKSGNLEKLTTYKDDVRHGILKIYNRDGKLSTDENYKEGKKHGTFKSYSDNGTLSWFGTYKDGKYHGPEAFYDMTDRLRREGYYKNDEKDGIFKEYDYETGNLVLTTPYKEGKPHGIEKGYNNDGDLIRIKPWKEGKPHGIEKGYKNDGTLVNEIPYQDGNLHGIKKSYYYSNGKIEKESPYLNGKQHGLAKGYRKDGKLEYEATYDDGKRHGIQRKYYVSGKLKLEFMCQNGKVKGPFTNYNEDGSVEKQGTN